MKSMKFASMILALLVGIFANPIHAAAKCPDVPGDLVCAKLRYSYLPASPDAGDEVVVIASWVDQSTEAPITNPAWLARQGKPAYLWMWDHEPTELESIAYVEGVKKARLPQIIVPLLWDAEKREYQGTFMMPESGRWYIRIGTVVPDALKSKMEADFDYVGQIQSLDISSTTGSLLNRIHWSTLSAVILGSGLLISAVLWLISFSLRDRNNHSPS